MARWIEPITLRGSTVTLEPLGPQHREALAKATADGNLDQLWYTFVPGPDAVQGYIEAALEGREQRGELPFAVRHLATGEVIGSTRYCHVDERHRRLEIGYTWYAGRFQRSAVNTECKRLLLGHAFETLDAIAVEFRTHWHNRASRAAIARLGAKQDGVLRNHQVSADGLYRDTVVFSIINLEWPAVRQNLDFRLQRGAR